jgi:hypothetical protein
LGCLFILIPFVPLSNSFNNINPKLIVFERGEVSVNSTLNETGRKSNQKAP